MSFIRLCLREGRLYRRNSLGFLLAISVACTLFLWLAATPATFTVYHDALAITFAIACAAILIGLNMSINLICRDFRMILREMRMGLSSFSLIAAKTVLVLILCGPVSLILILPYILGIFTIADQNTAFLFASVYCTMATAAEIGLFVSSLAQDKPQRAALMIPFITIFQIVFSGFIFERVQLGLFRLERLTLSFYAIRVLGSGLRFDKEQMFWDTPYGAFIHSREHVFANLSTLAFFFALAGVSSALYLALVDKGRLRQGR